MLQVSVWEDASNLATLQFLAQQCLNLRRLALIGVARTSTFNGRRRRLPMDVPFAPLAGLTALQNLQLTDCEAKGVEALAGLRSLDLTFDDADALPNGPLAHLATLTGLTALQLAAHDHTLYGLRHLAGLTGLASLRIKGWLMKSISSLWYLSALTALQVGSC